MSYYLYNPCSMQGPFTNGFGFPWISSIRLARVHSHGVTGYKTFQASIIRRDCLLMLYVGYSLSK